MSRINWGCRSTPGKKIRQGHSGCDLLRVSLAVSAALAKQRAVDCSKIVNSTIATSNESHYTEAVRVPVRFMAWAASDVIVPDYSLGATVRLEPVVKLHPVVCF